MKYLICLLRLWQTSHHTKLLLLLILFILPLLLMPQLYVTLNSQNHFVDDIDALDEHDNMKSLQIIQFCKSCPSPETEGSIVYGLISKYGVKDYHITEELIFCVPNHGQIKKMINKRQLRNKIGLVFRGEVSLHDKVLNAQAAGVLALIIIDDGQCDEQFLSCGKRIGGIHEGGFGAYDSSDLWHQITIPVLLVTKSTGLKLQKMMNYEVIDSPEWGPQYYPRLKDMEDEF